MYIGAALLFKGYNYQLDTPTIIMAVITASDGSHLLLTHTGMSCSVDGRNMM